MPVSTKMAAEKAIAHSVVVWASKKINAIDAVNKITIDMKTINCLQSAKKFWLNCDDDDDDG